MTLEATQSLTQTNTENCPVFKARSAPKFDSLTAICDPIINIYLLLIFAAYLSMLSATRLNDCRNVDTYGSS
jgi:hypothetical protein